MTAYTRHRYPFIRSGVHRAAGTGDRISAGSFPVGLVVGLILAVPLLVPGIADAATPTITFSGQPPLGLSTLACPSTPSRTTLTVTPGTKVNFVNRTGRTATLWAGDSQKDLPDRSLVPVTFAQGPAIIVVQMLPKCSLDLGKHAQMTVTVLAPGAAVARLGSQGGGPGTSADPTATGSGLSSPSPIGAGNPPANATGLSAATKPVFGSAIGPAQRHGASGLLTLIATAGLVGVSAAAIRAVLAQRANRTIAPQM